MSALHPAEARAIASAFTRGNPMRPRKVSANELCNSIRDLVTLSHTEIVQIVCVLAGHIKDGQHGLTDSCVRAVVDSLDDVVENVDQDFVNQEAV